MRSMGQAIMGAFKVFSSIPFIGVALGFAAGASIAALGMKYMSDGMIGPDGEMIVSGPKGSIQLDKEDSIIAGTNLIGDSKTPKEGRREERTGENSQKIIDLLTTQNNFLKTIAAKSSTIEMNGTEVGQGINQSERAIQ